MAAIYQWFPGVGWVLTSSVYPVEARDNVTFTLETLSAAMEDHFDEDAITVSVEVIGGFVEFPLIATSLEEDTLTLNAQVVGCFIETPYISTSTEEDTITVSAQVVDGFVTKGLVRAKSRVEDGRLQCSIGIIPEDCSLTDE